MVSVLIRGFRRSEKKGKKGENEGVWSLFYVIRRTSRRLKGGRVALLEILNW